MCSDGDKAANRGPVNEDSADCDLPVTQAPQHQVCPLQQCIRSVQALDNVLVSPLKTVGSGSNGQAHYSLHCTQKVNVLLFCYSYLYGSNHTTRTGKSLQAQVGLHTQSPCQQTMHSTTVKFPAQLLAFNQDVLMITLNNIMPAQWPALQDSPISFSSMFTSSNQQASSSSRS